MSSSFRYELLALCKSIQKKESAQQISQLIRNMSVIVGPIENGEKTTLHYDFAQIAQHGNNEFHGYLYLDDNIDSVKIPKFFKVEHLSSFERELLERGHKTISRFVELCLSEITSKAKVVSEAINPYSYFKPVKLSSESLPLLTDEEFQTVVTEFKNGMVYKYLMNADLNSLFGHLNINQMRLIIQSFDTEIGQSLGEDVAKDIKDFSLKVDSQFTNITEVVFAISILLYAVKGSLVLACKQLYRAICGDRLLVLNNENIISIDKNICTVLCHFYKVFSQDISFDLSGNEMGSVLLMDCDPPYGPHLHEFGMLVEKTINLDGEFGESAKYSFVTIDEEMICISRLTNEILRNGIPKLQVIPQ